MFRAFSQNMVLARRGSETDVGSTMTVFRASLENMPLGYVVVTAGRGQNLGTGSVSFMTLKTANAAGLN
jgi:hypothetical protein